MISEDYRCTYQRLTCVTVFNDHGQDAENESCFLHEAFYQEVQTFAIKKEAKKKLKKKSLYSTSAL